jgi:Flp pilus assembly protein TadD
VHLAQSLDLNQASAESHGALGLVLAQLNDMQGAKEHLEKAIALGDKSQHLREILSKVLRSLGQAK